MKKFLSLVLAMIMTMSLVTISAGATEYKDLTDKDEIQYEEAVAVLNRIGVITGYDDGSFRPETELTRGAAAKIIVSLLIGPEAANNLPNTYAPYPDVPANHTFAGVISYCKTAGIISGYGDGTFKPANSLTGYAFAKMLLGAIGYDSAIQGYVDTGWTMNVARDGNAAGLFNRIEFDGAAAVNREQACQLALNTLKATMVEYTGGLNVTAGNATVTAAPTLTYKISNQSYATNISNRKASNVGNANVNNHYTVEFGEEHFKDLRLNDEHGTQYSTDKDGKRTLNIARDDFGRPSNKWSYKKVTIGTFPIEPDFVYTERVIHRWDEKVTDAAKVRALELSGYNLKMDDTKENEPVDTTLWMNGVEDAAILDKVADIANYTDNGTQVEVYISEDDSDFIQDVVVVKTQLMEIKNIKSEAVALKVYDDGSDNTSGEGVDNTKGVIGFNSRPLDKKVNDVEVNDECYKTLSGMKVGDIVAVIPVAPEHENEEKFDVSRVYVPETVSGELTWVDTYGTEKSDATGIAVTVGGTDYDVALWNKDLTDIDGTSIRVTRKDVTLYLDEFGNALLAKNVGSTSDFMVIGGYHSGLVDGKVVTYADGWDIKGNELSLNIGNARYDNIGGEGKTKAAFPIGSLVHYSSSTNSKYAEWKLDDQGVFDVASKRTGETTEYTVKASNSRLVLNDYKDGTAYNNDAYPYYSKENDQDAGYVDAKNDNVYVDDNGVKVIYLTMGDDGEVDSVEVKSGMQNISNAEILGEKSGFADEVKRAQACVSLKTDNDVVNADSLVKAIVVKLESGNADLKDLIYVSRYLGSAGKAPGSDNTQRPVYGYEVHFVGSDDWDDEVTIYSYQDLDKGDFARARKPASFPEGVKNVTEDNFYTLTRYSKTQKALSTMEEGEIVFGDKVGFNIKGNKTLIELANYIPSDTNFSKAWPKDSKQDELDLGDDEIINILSLRGAKIIDLTRHEVQTTSEMVDELKELNKTANGELTFTVSALYNDDKDSDGFRDVHVLVITGTEKAPKHVDKDMFSVTVTADEAQVDVTGAPAADVKKGTAVTLTIAAKTGFKVDEVTVDGTPVVLDAEGKVTITVNDDVKVVVKSSVDTPDEPAVDVALGTVNNTDDEAPEGVTAKAANNKLTAAGLPDDGSVRVVVVKDGAIVSETTKNDVAIDYPEGSKAYAQKADMGIDEDLFNETGLFVPTITFDDSKVPDVLQKKSVQNATPVKFEKEYIKYLTWKVNGVSYTVEQVEVTINGKTVTAYRFCLKDTDAVAKAIKAGGVKVVKPSTTPAETGFVNFPGTGKAVTIPVDEKGAPQVTVKQNEEGTPTAIIPNEGVTVKVDGKVIKAGEEAPISAETPDIVEATSTEIAGLPFNLKVSTTAVKYGSTTKMPSDLSDDLAVTYDEASKTFKLTGTLKFIGTWTNFGDDTRQWFADLTVEQTNNDLAKIGYRSLANKTALGTAGDYRTVTGIKGSDFYVDGTGPDNSGNMAAKLTNNITVSIAKQSELKEKVYLKTTYKSGETATYAIDLSGLTLEMPELVTFSAVESEDTKVLDSKKISDIQKDVKVEVTGDGSVKSVKVSGTVYPVTKAWTEYQADATGYFVAIHADASALSSLSNLTWKNPNNGNSTHFGIDKVDTGKTNSGIVVIKVAGLETTPNVITAQATETVGGETKLCIYTIDFSGLELVKAGTVGDAKVTVSTASNHGTSFDVKPTSDFQDITITQKGDTFYFNGTLTPAKWTKGWGDRNEGYYVAFDVDVSEISGANAWSLKGAVGGNCSNKKDEMLYQVAAKNAETLAKTTASLYVLSTAPASDWGSESTAPANGCIKTYTLDFSGIKLAKGDPFTVQAGAVYSVPASYLTGSDFDVTVDHTEKKIVVTGTLKPVTAAENKDAYDLLKGSTVGFTVEEAEGYFVPFKITKGDAGTIEAAKATGVTGVTGGTDETFTSPTDNLVRVALIGKTDEANATLSVKLDGDSFIDYEFDFSGVTFTPVAEG